MNAAKIFLTLIIFSHVCYSQNFDGNIYVKFRNLYEVKGYSYSQETIINNDGLTIVRRGSRRILNFYLGFKDSVHVKIGDLDILKVSHLFTKINLVFCQNDFFPRQLISDGFDAPSGKIAFVCSGKSDTLFASNAASGDQDYYDEFCFSWNEIIMCMNALVPDKYSKYRIDLFYKTNLESIIRYREIRKVKKP
jgi:hypothetical protein